MDAGVTVSLKSAWTASTSFFMYGQYWSRRTLYMQGSEWYSSQWRHSEAFQNRRVLSALGSLVELCGGLISASWLLMTAIEAVFPVNKQIKCY